MSDTLLLDKVDTKNILGKLYKVVLFNDDDHSMEAVAAQIIKAIHCDETRALTIMLEAHKTGRAVVFTGPTRRLPQAASSSPGALR